MKKATEAQLAVQLPRKESGAGSNPAGGSILNEVQAAAYIGMSVHYLRKDRCSGAIGNRRAGPRYSKIGKAIRYNQVDLDAWLRECAMPTHQERARAR